MNTIEWSDAYLTGIRDIDQQHKHLVSLINQLIEVNGISVQSSEFSRLLNELVKYVYEHLEYEEQMLTEMHYPGFDDHKRLHEDYLHQFAEFSFNTMHQDETVPARAITFLHDWWENHILKEDMKYRQFMLENGLID